MEGRQKINKMLQEGRIDSDQASILLHALNESEKRRIQMFQDVINKKTERVRKSWGFLGMGCLVIFIFFTLLVYVGAANNPGRDMLRAWRHFEEAGTHLQDGQYKEAVPLLQKGAKKSPRYSLGYSLLAVTYDELAKGSQAADYGQKALKAREKARELAKKEKGGKNMTGTGLLFLMTFFVLVGAILGAFLLGLYNILVRREERVNSSWAQVAVLYQKKIDLLSALIDTAHQYADHEKETLQEVITARNKGKEVVDALTGIASSGKQKMAAVLQSQQGLDLGLGQINALAEKYPDIKANANYLTIQQEMTRVEDQIQSSRRRYNNTVNRYNTGLRVFPFNLMAGYFQFQPKGYYEQGK